MAWGYQSTLALCRDNRSAWLRDPADQTKTFFSTVADYLNKERPPDTAADHLFVALKGPGRGQALSPEGRDEVFSAARARAGLVHGACHESRHTYFTRPEEAGMAIEAIEALAGHRSIASSPIGSSSGAISGGFGLSAAKHPKQEPALARGQRGLDFAR
jgi:hypothetical protein